MSQVSRMEYKLGLCVRGAMEARRASWQEPEHQRDEYLRISRESMQDARIWRGLLKQARREAE
jgi:hypothetical protein